MEKLKNKESGIILYGLTPPKANNSEEKIEEISERRISRIKNINIDGLILYDIQDEATRNSEDRPFPFLSTIDPIRYKREYFSELDVPTIFYQCVGKYRKDGFSDRLDSLKGECAVLVGSSSKNEEVHCTISEAYKMAKGKSDLFLGGVTIPERHVKHGDEHHRLVAKQGHGVRFFISQFIFNIEKLKNMLSDYYYYCMKSHVELCPILFTVTPCGSQKTLDILEWLGVNVPVWIKNDLLNSQNTLDLSMDLCMNAVADISHFCMEKKIPFGCNVESVSIRKEEVLASFELVHLVEAKFKALGLR